MESTQIFGNFGARITNEHFPSIQFFSQVSFQEFAGTQVTGFLRRPTCRKLAAEETL